MTMATLRTPCHPLALLACLLVAGCVSTPGRAKPDESGAAGNLMAGFLVVDGVYNTELMAPYDVLEHANHHLPTGRGVEVFTVSPDGNEIVTAEGLRLVPDYSFATAPPIDVLIVPSARGSREEDLRDGDLVDWVRARGERAQYVMSLCWGAFLLAEAGLLDGYASTTFPADYARFARTYPHLDVRFNVSFVHDGGRLTSQGGARSYEVAMYLVDLLFGEETAISVGSGLLIPWPPEPKDRPAILSRPRSTRPY